MSQENDVPVKLPTIKVGWDEKSQGALMNFDQEEFRSWEMVIAVLEAAVSQAKFNQQVQRMGHLHAVQMQEANENQIRRNLGM